MNCRTWATLVFFQKASSRETTIRTPAMKASWTALELHPRHVFRISRAQRRSVRNVFLRLDSEGITGHGEASPNAFYAETAESVAERLTAARHWLESLCVASVADIESAWLEGWRWLAPSRAAQCAVDLALWDWLARSQGITVAELAWGEPAGDVPTFCTIGLSTPEELETKLAELAGFPRIKIKSDATAALDLVHAVRARSDALLALDANCAWVDQDLIGLSRELATLGVTFVEQPLPPGEESALPMERPLPIVADESCVTEDDIERVAGHFDGFNIKLVKCGGITPALRMARRGAALDRTVMVGCMLESSLLIAAGAVVAQRAAYADLDGAWLLADDPFSGWTFRRGILTPPSAPGLGAEPAKSHYEA
jgi:L-alanine-DL-glutamate epimerase-like enolase superfamily enzyme